MPNYSSINLRNEKDMTNKGVTQNMATNYISIINYGSAVSYSSPVFTKGMKTNLLKKR
jgi:hypothetical protein